MTSPPRSPTTDLADSTATTTISIADPDPESELTESIHTEPLDQLGNKLRSWRRTRQRLRGRVSVVSAGTDAGEDQDDSREAGGVKVDGHRNQAAEQEPKDGPRRFDPPGTATAGKGIDDDTRCKCCLRHILRSSSFSTTGPSKTVGGEIRIAGVDEDEIDQGGGRCETMREIKALDSDLILSAEIGLTLLTRLNTLQASYDPLLISHSTLQTTYADLVRSTHRQAEIWEQERERLERDLEAGRDREERLASEVKGLEGRLKRITSTGTGTGAGRSRNDENEESRGKEEMIKDLVSRNAILQHQLDRARHRIPQSQSLSGSPAIGSTSPDKVGGNDNGLSGDEIERRKRARRISLGYRSGSYSGPYTAGSTPGIGPPSSQGFGRGTRHFSENAVLTLGSSSRVRIGEEGEDLGRADGPDQNHERDEHERDHPGTGSTNGEGINDNERRVKLRPLSLSLSVSSRYTHAGPSGSHGVDFGGNDQMGHGRKISMTPSARSTISGRSPGLTGRESWVSSSTGGVVGLGMGAVGGVGGGWDLDSIVREADGTPVWPQPARNSASQVGCVAGPSQTDRAASASGWKSGSGSGSETTSPRTTMRAGCGSVGYSLNGIKRSMSVDRSKGGMRRVSGNQTVESIAEMTGQDETHERSTSNATSEMASEHGSTTRQRKRMSRYFHTPAYRPPTSPLINEKFSFVASSEPDSMVEGDRTSDSERPPVRMMDSKSTQTEPQLQTEVNREETPRMKSDAQVKLTLAGLGIEEDTPNSSSRTTPQLMDPYSPASLYNPSHQYARDVVESRTGALLLLVEHVSKILMRLRQADVPNLTRRLKKHHLVGGDVGHLSRGEMKALTNEIGEMRTHFRNVMEDERRLGGGKNPLQDSMITKRDFQLLLKLFKEIFGELIELRGIVNDVTVNPAAAVELRKRQEAIQAEEEEARGRGKAIKGGSGLGWIAAPITKLFAAPSSDPPARRPSDKALLQPPAIRSSAKLMPSTSATTTQVSVEFASTGQIRRATAGLPSANADHMDELPVSPADTLTRIPGLTRQGSNQPSVSRTPAIPLGDGSSRGPPEGNNRQSLYGIFAGGSTSDSHRAPARMNQTISGRHTSGRHRRQLSTVVDAVIDDDGPDRGLDEYQPPLLERTLRPRGLSDSSIRTTFQHHGIEIPAGREDIQPSALQYGSYWPATSVVKTLGRRIQALTGAAHPLPPSPMSTSVADESSSASQDSTAVPSPDVTTNAMLQVRPDEPRTIMKKRSANQLGLVSPASLTDGGGFLSMLSSSSTNEPAVISSKHSSPGIHRSESRTRTRRVQAQS